MSLDNVKFAIFKAINQKDAGIEQFKKSSDYVINHKKTAEGKLVMGRFLDVLNPSNSLMLIEKHHHNSTMTGRLFKHFVFSFGSPDLETGEAEKIMAAVMRYYKDYPYIGALHTDVPKRLHAHFLLGMRNLVTGKKFSQSKTDLMDFRKHFHKILLEAGLRGLKDCSVIKPSHSEAALNINAVSDDSREDLLFPPVPVGGWGGGGVYVSEQSVGQPADMNSTSIPQIAQSMFELVRKDLHDFFEMGYMGGLYDGKN